MSWTKNGAWVALIGLALAACGEEAATPPQPSGEPATDPSGGPMARMEAMGEAEATPDLALTWTDGCGFAETVPMGWERLRGEEMNPGDPGAARRSLATLPRLIVYRGDEPIYHRQGYGPGMEAGWPQGAQEGTIAGARLGDLDPGAGAEGALAAMTDEPGLTFVQFGAEWCTPCKAQAAVIAERRAEAGDLRYIAIDADPQKWAGDGFPACEA